MNLRAMATMRDAFGVPVGLSDHTRGIAVAAAAAALGAELVEKHFTLSRELEGPDHPFALEPDELKAMVDRDPRGRGRARHRPPRGPVGGRGRRDVPARAPLGDRRHRHPGRHRDHRGDADREAPGLRHQAEGHRDRSSAARRKVDIEFDDVITWEMV